MKLLEGDNLFFVIGLIIGALIWVPVTPLWIIGLSFVLWLIIGELYCHVVA